jgi:DNA-directed RNA polymerase specialized sigma24 family protein
LEQNHHLTAPDWGEELERKLCLNALVEQLPQQSRHMLHFRILGYSWKEIGRMLRISGKQARSRFYYDLNKAHTRLHGSGTNGAGHSEEPE